MKSRNSSWVAKAAAGLVMTGALAGAGYHSNLIPLFAVPRADGRASGKQIEGVFKDGDAVAQLVPRLTELLAR